MTVTVAPSDIGTRRTDADVVDGVVQFAAVVDTGNGQGYVQVHTDWQTPATLRDYAARINAAADWLEAN
jgi:KaiC/GvpD/RAD55 family RecA-like ATPase